MYIFCYNVTISNKYIYIFHAKPCGLKSMYLLKYSQFKTEKKHCRTATPIFRFLEDLKYNKEVEGV